MAYDPKRTRPDKAASDDDTQIDALLDSTPAEVDEFGPVPSAPVAVPPAVPPALPTSVQRFGVVGGVAAATLALIGIIALMRRRRRRKN
jgi:hypothetical protein